MKEELISFDTAELAWEKGFRIVTKLNPNYYERYNINKVLGKLYGYTVVQDFLEEIEPSLYLAPTQSLLQKWLREKHNIDTFSQKCGQGYAYQIYKDFGTNENITIPQKGWCDKYEEAFEKGLQVALKLIK